MTEVFRALNDPIRRRILEMLRKGDMNAGDIAAEFDISKPSISHHLEQLKQAELVISKKQGQFVVYSLNTSVLDEVLSWIITIKGDK